MPANGQLQRVLRRAASVTLSEWRHVVHVGRPAALCRTLGTSNAAYSLAVDSSEANCFGTCRLLSTKAPIRGDGQSISVDRTGLFHVSPHSHDAVPGKEPETAMAKHIKALIQVRHVNLAPACGRGFSMSGNLSSLH